MTIRKSIPFLSLLLLLPFQFFSQTIETKRLCTEGDWLERTPLRGLQVYDILQDSRGLMWFATQKGLMKFDGASFTNYEHNPNDINSISSNFTLRLLEDKQANIWVSMYAGLSVFDPRTEAFTNYKELPLDNGAHSFNEILSLVLDKNGTIWLGTDRGLCNYNPKEKKFRSFPEFAFNINDLVIENDTLLWITNSPQSLIKYNTKTGHYSEVRVFDENGNQITKPIRRILVTRQGEFWIYTYTGYPYRRIRNKPQDTEEYIFHPYREMNGLTIFDLKQSRNGDIWMVTKQGIYCFDSKSEQISSIAFEGFKQRADLEFFCLLEDDRSRFWAGINDGVVKIEGGQNSSFEVYSDFPTQKKGKVEGIATTCLEQLDDQSILVGRNDGLYIFDQKGKKITPVKASFPQLSGLDTLPVSCLFKDSQSGIWILPAWFSLIRFDLNSKKIRRIDQIPGVPYDMIESKDHSFWIGTSEGLFHYDLQRGILKRYTNDPENPNSLSDNDANSLALERDSLLWIGTRGGGLNCLNIKTGRFKRFRYDLLNPRSLSNNLVVDLHLGADGALWIATYGGGLCRMDKRTKDFDRFLKDRGLNTLNIATIGEDDENKIWIGTSEGLSGLDRNMGAFQNYNINKGAPFLVSWKSNVRDSEGYLYFGGENSFFRFHPQYVKKDTVVPRLTFTELYLNNQLVLPRQKNSPLEKSISMTNTIILKHHQNFIGLKFAALNFIQSEKNQYAYRMEGLFDEWQYNGHKYEVNFADLDFGEYLFQVKGSNQEGVWNEEGISLKIIILPPWYRTPLAYTIWTALFLGIIFWLYHFQLNRRLARAEAQHFKALDQAKTRLYTNITHEFRTPLTIILGMTDQVRKDPENWFSEGLSLIRRNGKQLLNLVNQLLDLSKLESGHLPLNLVQADVISYLHYLTESFHSYADSKDIRIHFRSDFPELVMDHDREKLQNILSNLLSNAIKFTPAGGDVYVDVRAGNPPAGKKAGEGPLSEILLQVSDTGEGITVEHLPHIFDRFYQADDSSTRRGDGTGIGLALTKELCKAMGGRIEVESEPGKGTRFSIWLPVANTAPQTLTTVPDAEPLAGTIFPAAGKTDKVSGEADGGRYTVLVVEDNPDVVTYLSSVLSLQFRILTASNGQEGIEKALEHSPDIIVSDVMMPVKDGFELCQELKTDERTSHIPIVLLTAKADQHSKIEGLAYGADAYLAKPFHQEELLVRLEKLIELRRRLQERFQQQGGLLPILEMSPQTAEDLFLQKVIRIIEAQLGDENFGMPQLCKALNMSRTNLFRKLKALTGKSATLFIRSLRLEKSKLLLETTEMNVTEVCFAVGFTSPNYFSRIFQEKFGYRPSEVKKG